MVNAEVILTVQIWETPVIAVTAKVSARVTSSVAAAGVACAAIASIAHAEEPAGDIRGRFTPSASVALVSDFRERGLTLSDNEAALQAGAELEVDGAGLSASGPQASRRAPTRTWSSISTHPRLLTFAVSN
jgi:hypothetical protein